ncbi:hypothetical protein [Salinispora pacifica]|uniref:hypothetical protein n=1 Tax=Salinispora pacifica TaxID=351187 RepID=UPI001EE27FD5|nr:hypothetical protein [Salinispora pacifica]
MRTYRRWTIVIATLVVASVVSVAGWAGAWSSIDIRIEGSYSARVLNADQAQQAWAELRSDPSGGLPPGEKLLVVAEWTDEQRTRWPATDCDFIVYVTHSGFLQVMAHQGDGYSLGSSGLAERAARRYVDIPVMEDHPRGGSAFQGSNFFIPATYPEVGELSVLLMGEHVDADLTRVGVLFTCNGRLIEFTWLEADKLMK